MGTTYTTKIGHSAISEHQTISGSPGDQTNTGWEVRMDTGYNVGSKLRPVVLLRPKYTSIAHQSALICEKGCNNNNIGYSQPTRTTLLTEAKKVNYDLSLITTPCNCDCSSFMSVCAIGAGARIDGVPTTHYMEEAFTKFGDYVAIKAKNHLTQTNFLKRGDILVRKAGHTVMVLENGVDHEASDYNITIDNGLGTMSGGSFVTLPANTNIPEKVNYINLSIDRRNVTSNALKDASCKFIIKDSKTDKPAKSDEISKNISKYNWSYKAVPLSDKSKKTVTGAISMTTKGVTFSIDNLEPSTSYAVEVIAKIKKTNKTKFTSPNLVFTTKDPCPSVISGLKVKAEALNTLNPKCSISFNAPTSWNTLASGSKGYRVSLIVNNEIKAYNDNLIKTNSSTVNQTINIKDITEKKVFRVTDSIQIGIQAWNKDKNNNYHFDQEYPKCSASFYIVPLLAIISRISLKIQNTFKQVIINDNLEGA